MEEIIFILEEALDTQNIHLVKQALDSLEKVKEDLEIDSDDSSFPLVDNYSDFD